jgi:hypothetical protein
MPVLQTVIRVASKKCAWLCPRLTRDAWSACSADALPPMTKEERNSHDKLRSRETKWAKMIAQWGKFFGDGKKISPKVHTGDIH